MTGLEQVRRVLTATFPDAAINVRDLTGTGDHVEAHIVTSAFEGKSLLERHRMVYATLGELMGGAIQLANFPGSVTGFISDCTKA